MAQKVEYLTAIDLLDDADLDSLADSADFQSALVTSTTDGADDYMIMAAFNLSGAGTGDVILYLWWDNNPGTLGPDRIDGASVSKELFGGTIADSVEMTRRAANGTNIVRLRPATIRDHMGFVPKNWGIILLNNGGATFGSGAGKYVRALPIRYIEG